MENMKSGVTKVIVDDETKLAFDQYGGGFFVAVVILKDDPFACCFQLSFVLGPVLVLNLEILPLRFLSWFVPFTF